MARRRSTGTNGRPARHATQPPSAKPFDPGPPDEVMGVPKRNGYPFPSAEQSASRYVSPFSDFVGGMEKDLTSERKDWAGRAVGPEGSRADVTFPPARTRDGVRRAHDIMGDDSPRMTRLVKPASGKERGQ